MGLANIEKDPQVYLDARDRNVISLFNLHAKGKLSEDYLRSLVKSTIGFDIDPLGPDYEGPTPWAYVIHPDQGMYNPLFTAARLQGLLRDEIYGSPLTIPVDELNTKKLQATKEALLAAEGD
jgi:hypothetical protein